MSSSPLTLARWQALSPRLREAVTCLHIDPLQIEFAGTIDRAIQSCDEASSDEVAGLAILRADRPIGFVVLSRGGKSPLWAPPNSVALTAMRIDARHQGQGLGKQALAAVDRWIVEHWGNTLLLALCVDDVNEVGKRAYAHAGFAEYMAPVQGRIGLVRYLSKRLAAAAGAG
jgi:RimJ/RimL family protein N-acetyltransferase